MAKLRPMGYLIVTLAAPAAGPLLYWALHERPRAARLVDGFVYLVVPFLLAWQVLPGAWERRSVLPLVAVAAGILIPVGIERAFQSLRNGTDAAALVAGLTGLLLHPMLEGAALGPIATRPTLALTLAITLHRAAEGLVVWWLLRPRYGVGIALGGIVALLLATTLGYGLGLELLAGIDEAAAELYQALVAGSLVHVVFHQGRHDHRHAGAPTT